MKKFLKSLLPVAVITLSCSSRVQGQITVESNTVMPVGMNYNINITDDSNMAELIMADAIPSGENAVWNYSNLNTVFSRNLKVVEPAAAPFGAALSGNRVLLMDNGTVDSGYLNANANGIWDTGHINGSGIKAANVPGELLLKFPAAYNNLEESSFESNIKFFVGIPLQTPFVVDSVRTRSITQLMYMIDGWGTLQTPAGSFEVLRQQVYKSTEHVSDFLRADTQEWVLGAETSVSAERSYVFWSNTQGYPLLRLRDIGDGGLINDVYWLANPSLSQVDVVKKGITFYPNPCQDSIVVSSEIEPITNIKIFDLMGRMVLERKTDQSSCQIDIKHLESGNYLMQIESNGGLMVKKMVKQ